MFNKLSCPKENKSSPKVNYFLYQDVLDLLFQTYYYYFTFLILNLKNFLP